MYYLLQAENERKISDIFSCRVVSSGTDLSEVNNRSSCPEVFCTKGVWQDLFCRTSLNGKQLSGGVLYKRSSFSRSSSLNGHLQNKSYFIEDFFFWCHACPCVDRIFYLKLAHFSHKKTSRQTPYIPNISHPKHPTY